MVSERTIPPHSTKLQPRPLLIMLCPRPGTDIMPPATAEIDTSEYRLLRATPDDAKAIYDVSQRAFQESFLVSQIYPQDKADLSSVEDLAAWRLRQRVKLLKRPNFLCFKIILDSRPEKVVAYVKLMDRTILQA